MFSFQVRHRAIVQFEFHKLFWMKQQLISIKMRIESGEFYHVTSSREAKFAPEHWLWRKTQVAFNWQSILHEDSGTRTRRRFHGKVWHNRGRYELRLNRPIRLFWILKRGIVDENFRKYISWVRAHRDTARYDILKNSLQCASVRQTQSIWKNAWESEISTGSSSGYTQHISHPS